jgi:hypothetical protein
VVAATVIPWFFLLGGCLGGGPPGRSAAAGRSRGAAWAAQERATQAGCSRCYLMVAIASATFEARSLVRGAEPAWSAAAFWPSSLATYSA